MTTGQVAAGLVAALAAGSLAAGAAGAPLQASGRLAGQTQISFGCPGPVLEGEPACNPWRPFPHARFSVARRAANGAPAPGTVRLVTSNYLAHFALALTVGTYLVTPLPQGQARGGPRLTVRVHANETTAIRVRFAGFPRMV